jgi:hypothetical protein
MLKHLVNQILGRMHSRLGEDTNVLNRWSETRKLRDAVRKHADLVSSFDAQVLYDIRESDYRHSYRRSAGWNQSL